MSHFLSWGGSDYVIGFVFFVIVLALLNVVLGILYPKRNVLKEYDDALGLGRDAGSVSADGRQRSAGLPQQAVQRLLSWRGYDKSLQRMIDDGGLRFRASEFVVLQLTIVIAVAVVVRVIGGGLLVALIVAVVAGLLPLVYLDRKRKARLQAFESQVPNTLTLMAGSLRAGQGFEQALLVAATEASEPTASELRRVLAQQRLGVAPEEALRDVAERTRSEAFGWVVMATVIQRQVGGNLAEVYESIAETLRERAKMGREVKTLTAEGRLSANILIVLPFGIALIFVFANPTYLGLLWRTNAGLAMMGLGVVLLVIGFLWLRRITRVDA